MPWLLCVFFIFFLTVEGRSYRTCFGHCKCSDGGKLVMCTSMQLTTAPAFPWNMAEKVEVLGLQRNHLLRLDGASLAHSLPALRIIDLRDQGAQPCVLLSSPFPTRVTVIGATCVDPIRHTATKSPHIFPPPLLDDDADGDDENEEDYQPDPPPRELTTRGSIDPFTEEDGVESSNTTKTTLTARSEPATPALVIPGWCFNTNEAAGVLHTLVAALSTNRHLQVGRSCFFL